MRETLTAMSGALITSCGLLPTVVRSLECNSAYLSGRAEQPRVELLEQLEILESLDLELYCEACAVDSTELNKPRADARRAERPKCSGRPIGWRTVSTRRLPAQMFTAVRVQTEADAMTHRWECRPALCPCPATFEPSSDGVHRFWSGALWWRASLTTNVSFSTTGGT
jgi:hypothetical protein